MGGKGSGRKGPTAQSPTTGRFVIQGAVTMTAVGAIDTFDMVGKEQRKLQSAMDQTNKEMEEQVRLSNDLQQALDKTGKETTGLLDAQTKQLVLIQSITSGVNQLTGGLYKAIAGAEALNIVNEEQARKLQETVRSLELLTGTLEVLLAIELLLVAFTGKGLIASLGLQTLGFSGVAAAAGSAAISVGLFLLTVASIVIFVTAIVILFVKLNEKFDLVGKSIGVLNAGVMIYVNLIKEGVAAGQALASSLSSLGDAFTDNPITKGLAKAGGAIL